MKKFFTSLLLFVSFICFSQTNTVAYTRDFEFKEGIYLTINQFTTNNPIPVSSIVSSIAKSQFDFLGEIVKGKEIVYKDNFGNEQRVATNSIWGYCQNRIIHINYNKKFARINVIGALCQFTAMVTSTISYQSPMFYGYPGYGFSPTTTTVEELKQFILDTRNNEVVIFSESMMEALLQDDDELYKEFMQLKYRKRKDALFIYVRKYNDRHPLYLPTE